MDTRDNINFIFKKLNTKTLNNNDLFSSEIKKTVKIVFFFKMIDNYRTIALLIVSSTLQELVLLQFSCQKTSFVTHQFLAFSGCGFKSHSGQLSITTSNNKESFSGGYHISI